LNLLTNAIKYASEQRQLSITIKTAIENDRTVLLFTDNGSGIDMKKHGAKLFGLNKTFHRNKDATGIGLFMTKMQIETLGGKIEAESEIEKGTTFRIIF